MKTRKRLLKTNLSLVIVFILVFSLIPLSVFSSFAEGLKDSAELLSVLTTNIDNDVMVSLSDKNENGYYDIGNADELYAFAKLVNDGNVKINAELVSNIVINEGVMAENTDGVRVWVPIGKSIVYKGTFNGNNKTVSGIYFNSTSMSAVGLFSGIGAEGKIENVGIINSYIKGKNNIGGVLGFNSGGEVVNCYNTSIIVGTALVGGIVGDNGGGNILSCYNAGIVKASDEVGGVVGKNYSDSSAIINCYNIGDVNGVNFVGGVVGSNLYGKVRNCFNIGAVVGTMNYVGEVCGYNYKTIENCYYLKTAYSNAGVGYTVSGGKSFAQIKNIEQFRSGEVAYFLQGEQSEEIWGQNIGVDDYPNFNGETVCASENENGEIIYINMDSDTEAITESTGCTETSEVVNNSSVLTDPMEIATHATEITKSTEVTTYTTMTTESTMIVTEPTEITATDPIETTSSEPTETTEVTDAIVEPTESKPGETTVTELTECVETSIATTMATDNLTEPSTPDETKPSEPTEDKGVLGDVNGDGKVNVKDATFIQKAAAKITKLTDDENMRADVNGDGKVNVKDATAIQKFAAKIETGFTIGEKIN